jgi:hypothetical protein
MRLPLEQVIDSLKSQLRLLQESIEVLEAASPGSELRIVSIKVDTVKSGSLIIDLLLQLYGTYQKNIDERVIGGVESLLGVDVPPEYETLVTLILLGVTYFVSRMVYDAVRKKKGAPPATPIHIDGNYNNVITIIAGKLEITPE